MSNIVDLYDLKVHPEKTYYVSGLTLEDEFKEPDFKLVRPSATPNPYVTFDKTRLYSAGHHSALFRVDLEAGKLIKEADKHFIRTEQEPDEIELTGTLRAQILKTITTGINFLY